MKPQMNADERRWSRINVMTNQAKVSRETLNSITQKIIGCAFTVSNKLGSGFLERVYENALAYELRQAGIKVE